MRIVLVAVGERVPAWVTAGFSDYVSRLPANCRLLLHEVRAGRRTKGADLPRLVREEGDRLRAAIPKGFRTVALDRSGRALSSEELALELQAHLGRGENLALLVGGPEGLSDECLSGADACWSLSRLTLSHSLVRVVVAEQVYRAWAILNRLPYHR